MIFETKILRRDAAVSQVFKSAPDPATGYIATACSYEIARFYDISNVLALVIVASTTRVRDASCVRSNTVFYALNDAMIDAGVDRREHPILWWWIEIVEAYREETCG